MAAKAEITEIRKRWEREESKFVRPFKSADDYLKDAAFRLYEGAEFAEGPVFQVDSVDRERLAPAIRLAAPPIELEELVGAPMKDLLMIVSIEDRVLKRSTVLQTRKIAEVTGEVIELGDDVREATSWAGDTRLHIAVVLSRDRKAAVGLAQRAGSWVAKKTFQITRMRNNATFSITPVDEAWFQTRGLPASTTYYVEMLGQDLNQPCDSMPDLAKVYISQSLNAALARDEDSAITKALIKGIYVDVVSTILAVGYCNLEGELVPDSILDVVSARLTKATNTSYIKLTEYARENNGARLRAVIQAEAELTRIMLAASGRKSV